MNSDQYLGLQSNYYTPLYFNAPTFDFGNFYVSTINVGQMPIFSIKRFYTSQNGLATHSSALKIENIPQNREKTRRSKRQLKKKPKVQVINKKNKNATRWKTKKNSQKDDRNVVSNLFKNFFKYLIVLRKWDQYLKSLIQKCKFQTSLKRFFQWVSTFQLNYRNYIKAKQIKVLLTVQSSGDHQLMFRAVLRRYVYLQGVPHCLTARKIDRLSVQRHVKGLRQLQNLSNAKQI